MIRSNYSAWHINSKEFSQDWTDLQKLQFFARYAILAPSGHNTQPWHFTHEKQALVLQANYDRQLPYSGIQANEPYVSLGTCLGTLQLAAKGFGYKISIAYTLDDSALATITLGQKTTADSSLLTAITRRVSNRNYYDTNPLPDDFVSSISQTKLDSISIHSVSQKAEISFIAEQTSKATHKIMGDKEFRSELSKWVRNNVTKQHDGMPGFVQGIPTPPSLIARHIIKRFNISKDQAKKDASRILHSANLVIVSVQEQSKEALLNAGRLYAQICVLAEQQGIASTGMGAAIIDPQTKKEIVQKFNLAGQPIAIIRLGKAASRTKHTPRWPLHRVTS